MYYIYRCKILQLHSKVMSDLLTTLVTIFQVAMQVWSCVKVLTIVTTTVTTTVTATVTLGNETTAVLTYMWLLKAIWLMFHVINLYTLFSTSNISPMTLSIDCRTVQHISIQRTLGEEHIPGYIQNQFFFTCNSQVRFMPS